MRLDRIPSGAPVFLDANIFIYHFTGHSQQCTALLARCERGQPAGVTGVHVLAEVAHRLMAIEAVRKGLVTTGNVAAKLRAHPQVVRRLTDYQANIETLLAIDIQVVSLESDDLVASGAIRRTTGLLMNDSLSVAMLRREGISALATTDRDFGRVSDLRVFVPDDLSAPRQAGT
jgi:predicted nucleic acid-binding protein